MGIARLAAEGEPIREGHNVEYFTIATRSILNRCSAPYMPFQWTINPYRGCEFACKYCYARYTHEFMEMRNGADFERRIYVKQNVAEQLRHDLKQARPGEMIAIGTATDPYQPAERRYQVTRAILQEFTHHLGLEIAIVTKSNLVLRDVDLLRRIAQHNRLTVNLTITTLDRQLARVLEPRAPRPDLRLEAVRTLTRYGLDTGISCAPVIPGITDSMRNLDALVAAAKEAGARHIFANPLFLKPCSAAIFLPFLEREFPALVESYRRRYQERAFVPAAYRKRISQMMSALRRKHGMLSREERRNAKPPAPAEAQAPEQMWMFG